MLEFQSPEEAAAYVEQENKRRLDARHAVRDMLAEMTERSLQAFSDLMCQVAHSDNGPAMAGYFHGIANHALDIRFGRCIGCDQIHVEHLDNMIQPRRPSGDMMASDVDAALGDMEAAMDDVLPAAPDLLVGEAGELSPRQLAEMDQYHLDDLREEGTRVLLGFICTKCTMKYNTIENRVALGGDEAACAGCAHRAKHG